MADESDYADQLIEDNISRSVANIRAQVNDTTESNLYCDNCDEEIPEGRRKAVKGCRYCAACQSKIEFNGLVVYRRH